MTNQFGNYLHGYSDIEQERLITQAFHYYSQENSAKIQNLIAYIDSWLAPTVPLIVKKLSKNKTRLQSGLEWFRNIVNQNNGAATVVIYRASGKKSKNNQLS